MRPRENCATNSKIAGEQQNAENSPICPAPGACRSALPLLMKTKLILMILCGAMVLGLLPACETERRTVTTTTTTEETTVPTTAMTQTHTVRAY